MDRRSTCVSLALMIVAALHAGSSRAQANALPPSAAAAAEFQMEPTLGENETAHGSAAPEESRRDGQVLETRPPYNLAQRPAFSGQTRAPAVHTRTAIEAIVVASGLANPWGLAFLPDGRMLITERRGTLRIISRDGAVSAPITDGVPKVFVLGAAGLLDVALDPDFAHSRRLFITYVELRPDGIGTSLASARLSADERKLEAVTTLVRGPSARNSAHTGGRMLMSPDGTLLAGMGERFTAQNRIRAQDLDFLNGKVIRLALDGSAPADNPFAKATGANPLIWTYGNRNPQGLAFEPGTGKLWESEHGPQGGDEINVLEPGHNYGWPLATYGLDYGDQPMNGGKTQWPGTDQPVYFWDPTIAPSGITFYSGTLIPEWRGNLFVAALAGQHLARLVIRHGRVTGEERLLQDQHQRVRTVLQGPDGALWVLTDSVTGRLIRLAPKGK